jgi:hypothetical protein
VGKVEHVNKRVRMQVTLRQVRPSVIAIFIIRIFNRAACHENFLDERQD